MDNNMADKAVGLWKQFKEDQPELAFILSVAPVSGQVAAAAEYYDAMSRGDSADGVFAAMQFIPVAGKGLRAIGEAVKEGRNIERLAPLMNEFSQAKVGRNGETISDFFSTALKRAGAKESEVVGGVNSLAANLADYAKDRSAANRKKNDDAFSLGFDQVSGQKVGFLN